MAAHGTGAGSRPGPVPLGPGDGGPAVAGLLLAAGGGRRLGGRPKALLEHRGRLLVEHAADALVAGGCSPVHVVLGAGREEVRARARLAGCVLVDNPEWAEGVGSSLRAGLRSLAGSGAQAVVVALVDQPGVGPEAVRRVRGAHRSPYGLAAASYRGRRGHPVLLGAGHWARIASAASGDRGARDFLRARREAVAPVDCGDTADPSDIDVPADLRLLRPPPPSNAPPAAGL
ncbi:nucleotidyltransferase family protein [Streptomyces sp. HB2AG]|uniref:nucleotidyltransferase family protein n=1 Tax=Streptomyces sp. HB2AG TaxID=2983400 RepID=UPI0022AAC3FA|nr:nucleotidyltransferase family protein [Streptomyces sp. HB2AG]MCZ2525604.1 nucleotidyltransferase family protein [Streptomyces sp. HB2AG]